MRGANKGVCVGSYISFSLFYVVRVKLRCINSEQNCIKMHIYMYISLYWRLFTVQYVGFYLVTIIQIFWSVCIKLLLVNIPGIIK
jgi:hypothetical protein